MNLTVRTGTVGVCRQAPHYNFYVKRLCASHLLRTYPRCTTQHLWFILLASGLCCYNWFITKHAHKQTVLKLSNDLFCFTYTLWGYCVNAQLHTWQTLWLSCSYCIFNCKLSIPQGLCCSEVLLTVPQFSLDQYPTLGKVIIFPCSFNFTDISCADSASTAQGQWAPLGRSLLWQLYWRQCTAFAEM